MSSVTLRPNLTKPSACDAGSQRVSLPLPQSEKNVQDNLSAAIPLTIVPSMPIRLTQVGALGMILGISDYPRNLMEFSIFSLLDGPSCPYRVYPAALRVFDGRRVLSPVIPWPCRIRRTCVNRIGMVPSTIWCLWRVGSAIPALSDEFLNVIASAYGFRYWLIIDESLMAIGR